jgi:hypothetical protein
MKAIEFHPFFGEFLNWTPDFMQPVMRKVAVPGKYGRNFLQVWVKKAIGITPGD